jgi:hypothetical protein
MNDNNSNSTLLMVGIVAAIVILSAAVIVVPIQQASAQDTDFSFDQRQSNECSGFAGCSNLGSIIFGTPPDF